MATYDDLEKARKDNYLKGYNQMQGEIAFDICTALGLYKDDGRIDFNRLNIIQNLIGEHDNPVQTLEAPVTPSPSLAEIVRETVKELMPAMLLEINTVTPIVTPSVLAFNKDAPVDDEQKLDILNAEDDDGDEDEDDTVSIGTYNDKSLPEEANISLKALNTSSEIKSQVVDMTNQVAEVEGRGNRKGKKAL